MVWAHRQGQWKGTISLLFSEEADIKLHVVSQCVFRLDFLFLRTTIVSKYDPSACMSCCSDDLAQLLPCLDLGLKIYRSKNKFLPLIDKLRTKGINWG